MISCIPLQQSGIHGQNCRPGDQAELAAVVAVGNEEASSWVMLHLTMPRITRKCIWSHASEPRPPFSGLPIHLDANLLQRHRFSLLTFE